MGDHRLAARDVERSLFVRDAENSFQHDRVLVELGRLPRFLPPFRTSHVGDAHVGMFAIHAADKLIDQLRLVSRSFNSGWLKYGGRHFGS